jgi:hypothetical protein
MYSLSGKCAASVPISTIHVSEHFPVPPHLPKLPHFRKSKSSLKHHIPLIYHTFQELLWHFPEPSHLPEPPQLNEPFNLTETPHFPEPLHWSTQFGNVWAVEGRDSPQYLKFQIFQTNWLLQAFFWIWELNISFFCVPTKCKHIDRLLSFFAPRDWVTR